ncbi:restriction endonuclease subunit S [Mycoplasmopsis arginini]|uniref:restriction endonuclease subunit S n=1 Tax=Mycoplasmopsis arginini TaxID=2094 RepID=UPI000764CB16|nr:restriction endonuclease subunit S [Mycoplasmopsis arginini]
MKKKKLIAEGKIKKDKSESYIFKGDDNCYYEKIGKNEPVKLEYLPFDIPDNWTWIRLKSLANIYNGNSINEDEKKKKYTNVIGRDFIATKDVGFDRTIAYNNGVNIPYELDTFKIAPANKILMCIEGGSAGRKIAITDRDVCFGNKLACFDSFIVNDVYLFNIFQSNEFTSIFKSSLTGIIGGVSINTLKDFIISLPPLEEQQRIVDKINSFEALLQEYEGYEKKLTELESTFAEKLKKSILQYAIEGKLVKQDPNDEPASVLLERIKNEKEKLIKEGKIKRDKNESYIYQGDDKNYYENLPSGWVLTNLSKVISLTSGTDLKPEEYSQQNIGVPYITGASNISCDNKIIINRFTHQKYVNSHLNEILLSCKGTIGKIVNNNVGDIHVARQFMSINSFINKEFLIIYLHTLIAELSSEAKSMIPGIDRNQVLSKVLALPPLKEQIRIVSKVNNLIFF